MLALVCAWKGSARVHLRGASLTTCGVRMVARIKLSDWIRFARSAWPKRTGRDLPGASGTEATLRTAHANCELPREALGGRGCGRTPVCHRRERPWGYRGSALNLKVLAPPRTHMCCP